METQIAQDINEVPVVIRRNEKSIDEVVADIIKADLCDSDGIMQLTEHHEIMLHTQRMMKDFMNCNYSMNKDELFSVIMRCEEVLMYLNLINDASEQNRYKSKEQVHGGGN